MADPIFAKGLFVRRPNEKTKEKAPWVKLHLGVRVDEFVEFAQANKKDDGFINLDLKTSKEGDKLYFELDTFVPKKDKASGTVDTENEVSVNDVPTGDTTGSTTVDDANAQAMIASQEEKENNGF